jgi:methylmalonyl-CoA mutase N-terminal domain/subunit
MEILFDGIPLDQISTSMTINPPAAMLLAMYIVVGEKQGVPANVLTGTIQNDMLKEYEAQKTWIYPPLPSMRIITDILAYCSDHVSKWNTISISGYHIREAGSTALQELAFTLANGYTYVEYGIKAGLDVDKFAPRLSFFFNAHLDFFEEIAKYRAARRIWARLMREKYNAQDPRSHLLRFHTQTAGCTLTAQQPTNNIIRTAYQALAAVLGGTQSLHTNSMDETYALPTEKAVKIALRTQQLLAYETGVANTVDPLGGSYLVEALTDELEKGVYEYFKKIEKFGGVIPAIEKGFFQKEIARSAYVYQKALEKKQKYHIGINIFEEEEKPDIEILRISSEVENQKRTEQNKSQ